MAYVTHLGIHLVGFTMDSLGLDQTRQVMCFLTITLSLTLDVGITFCFTPYKSRPLRKWGLNNDLPRNCNFGREIFWDKAKLFFCWPNFVFSGHPWKHKYLKDLYFPLCLATIGDWSLRKGLHSTLLHNPRG